MKKTAFFVKMMTALLLSGGLSSSCSDREGRLPSEQQLFIGDSIAIARTEYGRVQGFLVNDIYTFRGIPYGASTAGENRFMPPQPPDPWEGIRPAVFWGNDAPQDGPDFTRAAPFHAWQDCWRYYGIDEDCLNLNVWTPGLADGKRRPVLVWFHGGSWVTGNSVECDSYQGENLSRYGDIVFVSVNHRVGPFGLVDFSEADPRFSESGMVSELDMVAALQWVHDNIAHFGGDPRCVTVMGQSGGGSKVCTLLAMPEIGGLVHRGVALSGSNSWGGSPEPARSFGAYLVEKTGKTVPELQQMPWQEFNKVAYELLDAFNAERRAQGKPSAGFHPSADGHHLPEGRFYQDKSLPGNDIPLLLCSCTSETSPAKTNARMEEIGWDEAVEEVAKRYGPVRADALVDGYRKAFPDRKPIDIVGLIGWGTRRNTIAAADAKTFQDAPVYVALFDWHSPLFDGRARAFHTSDICFWFRNTDLMLTHTGGGRRPRELSRKMADALLAFMRSGDPNCRRMPSWPEYDTEHGWTMVLDDRPCVMEDIDREARKAYLLGE